MRFGGCLRYLLLVLSTVGLATTTGRAQVTYSKVQSNVQRVLGKQGGTVKVWIMFADKGTGPSDFSYQNQTALARLHETYNTRAIQRRRLRRVAPGLFDERDLAIPQQYVNAIRATGARIRITSRWLNAVSAVASTEQIDAIAALPFIQRIQLVNSGRRVLPPLPEEPVTTPSEVPKAPLATSQLNYGLSEAQLNQINVTALHDLGYTGNGVVLGVLDTGFYKDHESIQTGRIIAEWDFVQDDDNTQNEAGDLSIQHNHGTTILSVAAGLKDGMLYGPAYEAELILCKTEDMSQEAPIEEDWYVAGLEFAESNGADVVTSSLGYIGWYTQSDLDGQTAVTTVAVNVATDNGVFCCTAAGNSGPTGPSLIAPADAFDVITVGAVDSGGAIAGFSSRGPTADGRVKPEVLACGLNTYGASAISPSSYTYSDGTSLATPLVAGTVACLLQAHPDWSVARMRGALCRTADYYLANGTYDPSYARGYGLIDALAAHQKQFAPADFDFDDDVDSDDLTHLQDCTTGPAAGPPSEDCLDADFDGDNDIDQSDFGQWQRCYTGTDIPADPNCAQ